MAETDDSVPCCDLVGAAGADVVSVSVNERELPMPNGKPEDNPLTDLVVHGAHPFPPDIEKMLLRIDDLGRGPERWPLGENWPFSGREFDWKDGIDLDGARRDLGRLILMLEQGRGEEILIDPLTGKPFIE